MALSPNEGQDPAQPAGQPGSDSVGVKAEASSKPSKTLRLLYLYAGKARRSGTIRAHMLAKIRALRLMTQERIKLVIKEVDLLNDAVKQDLSRDDVWHHIVQELDEGKWEEIMLSPPCNTHSRVLHTRQGKPKPFEAYSIRWGFHGSKEERRLKWTRPTYSSRDARRQLRGVSHRGRNPDGSWSTPRT